MPMTHAGGNVPIRAVFGGLTDVGHKREHNEDHILVRVDLGLFILADGMGGHNAGDVASKLATSSLVSFFEATRGQTYFGIPPEGYDARRLCAVGLPGGAGRGAEQGRQLPTDIPLSRPRSRQRDRGRVGRSVGAAQQYLETLWRGLGAVLRSGAGTRQQLSAGPLRRSGPGSGFSTSAPRRRKSRRMCARSWRRF